MIPIYTCTIYITHGETVQMVTRNINWIHNIRIQRDDLTLLHWIFCNWDLRVVGLHHHSLHVHVSGRILYFLVTGVAWIGIFLERVLISMNKANRYQNIEIYSTVTLKSKLMLKLTFRVMQFAKKLLNEIRLLRVIKNSEGQCITIIPI